MPTFLYLPEGDFSVLRPIEPKIAYMNSQLTLKMTVSSETAERGLY